MLERSIAELRFTLRYLARTPGFSLVAILALGLGIGANTAILSGVNALLLGPMPYGNPERLVALWEDASAYDFPRNNPAPANYFDWQRYSHSFSGMAALRWSSANLTGGTRPEAIVGKGVTPNFFSVLKAYPKLGRVFSKEEDRNDAKVVVIGHDLWKRRFNGDRAAIGKTLYMDGQAYSVIGVMPPGFSYPNRMSEYWRPAHFTAEEASERGNRYLEVVARLRDGVSPSEAQVDMSAVAKRLELAYPDDDRSIGAVVVPLRSQLVGDTGSALLLLSAAAILVLLIACANVANLLLIRGAERGRELALRSAIGASRGRIIAHLLLESSLLGLAGTVAGLLFASAGIRAIQLLIPEELVNASTLSLNLPVLGFAVAVALRSVLLFGLLPAMKSSAVSLNLALKQGGRGATGSSHGLQRMFVVSQVAFALVLLAGAGLLIQTLSNLHNVTVGFPTGNLLVMATPLSPQSYQSDVDRLSFYNRVLQQVSQVPAVRSAAFSMNSPFTAEGNTISFLIEGRAPAPDDQFNDALYREVSTGYLQTLGARLLSGRLLSDLDAPALQPAVVINKTFAIRYWPHRSPVGRRIRVGDQDRIWRTVVGVIADVKERGLKLDMKPAIYLPITQVRNINPGYLVVRTATDPLSLVNSIKRAVATVDPDQPVANVKTMDEYVAGSMREQADRARLLGIFVGLALFLATLGIYGVLAYSIAQRRKEIGLRMALGADAARVTRLVVKKGLSLTAFGLLSGLLLTFVCTRAMQSLLFGVQPLDPASLLWSFAALLIAALVACLLPSIRAARASTPSLLCARNS